MVTTQGTTAACAKAACTNAFAALALMLSMTAAAWAGEDKPQPKVGETPPAMLGKMHGSGQEVNLADFRGKVVIVTFWASWCGPCLRELPVLSHFQQVVGRDALQVIAVNFKEPRQDFLAMLRANRKFDLDYVHDAKGYASDDYGVQSLPNMFILDRDGVVAHVHRGYSQEMLPGIIEEVLELLPEEVRNRPASVEAPAS